MKSHQVNIHYVDLFFSRRILSLLVPYSFYVMLYWFISLFQDEPYTISKIVVSMFDGNPIVTFSWYVIVLFFFYIFFYLMMKMFKEKFDLFLWGSILYCVIWALLCYSLKRDTYWYNACFCAPLGIWVAIKEKQVFQVVKNHYCVVLLITVGVLTTAVICGLTIANSELEKFFFSCSACIAFAIFVHLFAMKFRINNRIWLFLSGISLEVYLTHPLVMRFLRGSFIRIENDVIWGLAVIIITIPLSYLLHLMFGNVISTVQQLLANDKKNTDLYNH